MPPSTAHPVVSTLANGLTLIVQPEDVSDTVSVYGHIRNRPEMQAPPGKEGVVAAARASCFAYGSEQLDRLAFQQALDAIGASEARRHRFLGCRCWRSDFDRGVELLADNELHPALPAASMEIMQRPGGPGGRGAQQESRAI